MSGSKREAIEINIFLFGKEKKTFGKINFFEHQKSRRFDISFCLLAKCHLTFLLDTNITEPMEKNQLYTQHQMATLISVKS
jgi:hypothetical protein